MLNWGVQNPVTGQEDKKYRRKTVDHRRTGTRIGERNLSETEQDLREGYNVSKTEDPIKAE